eukprot:Phypoly_transcript_18697.p1 GENE.Phypoly_transcript_18697~~Phypoly_transcript_18697.p1  ORF type:complete len:212 (+),score=37.51 Phypoly_transcript_18697:33-668(+)
MNILNNVVDKLTGNSAGAGGGRLFIQCIEARNLARKDLLSKSDPYCVFSIVHKHNFSLLSSTQKTTTINNNQNPVWNQSFTFNVSNPETELLKVKVYDNDPLSFDDEIGEVDIPLFALRNGMPKDDWYQLFPAKGGAVHLVLTAQGFGMGAPGMQAGAMPYGVPQAGGFQQGYPQQPVQPGYGAPAYGYAAQPGYAQPGYPQPGYPQPGYY